MNIINKKTAIFAPQLKDVYHDYKTQYRNPLLPSTQYCLAIRKRMHR